MEAPMKWTKPITNEVSSHLPEVETGDTADVLCVGGKTHINIVQSDHRLLSHLRRRWAIILFPWMKLLRAAAADGLQQSLFAFVGCGTTYY